MTTQFEAARVERGPITEVKRFALGMADLLERQGFTIAAAELRRLHAQRDALLKALHNISLASQDSGSTREGMGLYARAAIKAAEENT